MGRITWWKYPTFFFPGKKKTFPNNTTIVLMKQIGRYPIPPRQCSLPSIVPPSAKSRLLSTLSISRFLSASSSDHDAGAFRNDRRDSERAYWASTRTGYFWPRIVWGCIAQSKQNSWWNHYRESIFKVLFTMIFFFKKNTYNFGGFTSYLSHLTYLTYTET